MFSFNVNLSLNWNGRFMTTWHGMTNCRPIGYFDPAMDPEWCPFTSLFEIPFGFTMVHPAWLMIFMDLYGSRWYHIEMGLVYLLEMGVLQDTTLQ